MTKDQDNDTTSAHRTYGWRAESPDERDHLYPGAPTSLGSDAVPSTFDLRSNQETQAFLPNVYNQGKLGSCTANAIAAAFEFNELREGGPDFMPSRLFIYYNERKMEGSTSTDAGASIRDGIKSINKIGVCSEALWPYDESKFATEPPQTCYDAAKSSRSLSYRRVAQSLRDIKYAIGHDHEPVVFGFTVYESFESEEVAKSGVMPQPKSGEKVLGGHAVCAVGYDDETGHLIVRNSWGDAWGQGGYFLMPYDFVTNPQNATDFWIVKTVSCGPTPAVDPIGDWATYPGGTAPEIRMTSRWASGGGMFGCGGDGEEVSARAGEAMAITWSTKGKVDEVRIDYCLNSWTGMFSAWQTVSSAATDTGRFDWVVPEELTPDNRYYLRLSAVRYDRVYDYCDSKYFTVQAAK